MATQKRRILSGYVRNIDDDGREVNLCDTRDCTVVTLRKRRGGNHWYVVNRDGTEGERLPGALIDALNMLEAE